jgi:hypothetical protein
MRGRGGGRSRGRDVRRSRGVLRRRRPSRGRGRSGASGWWGSASGVEREQLEAGGAAAKALADVVFAGEGVEVVHDAAEVEELASKRSRKRRDGAGTAAHVGARALRPERRGDGRRAHAHEPDPTENTSKSEVRRADHPSRGEWRASEASETKGPPTPLGDVGGLESTQTVGPEPGSRPGTADPEMLAKQGCLSFRGCGFRGDIPVALAARPGSLGHTPTLDWNPAIPMSSAAGSGLKRSASRSSMWAPASSDAGEATRSSAWPSTRR